MSPLRKMLIRHEGLRLQIYQCPAGKTSIGVGRNLEDRGITCEEAMVMLDTDIQIARNDAGTFPWFKHLNEVRQAAIVDMLFMGLPKFLTFRKMIGALADANYDRAADEILSSAWAGQVGKRASEIAQMMRSGNWPQESG